jgi:hypothetical protein
VIIDGLMSRVNEHYPRKLVCAKAGLEHDSRATLSDAMQVQAVATDIQQLSRSWIALRVAAVMIAS